MSLAPIPDVRSRPVERRVCAASGLAFLVCSAAGLLLANIFATAFYPSPFGPPFGPQTDVLAYFSANRVPVRAMSFVFALAALALLIFVAYSVELFADTPTGRRAGLAGLALGAGGGVLAAHRAAAVGAQSAGGDERVRSAAHPARSRLCVWRSRPRLDAGRLSRRHHGGAVADLAAAPLDHLDLSGGGISLDASGLRPAMGAGQLLSSDRPRALSGVLHIACYAQDSSLLWIFLVSIALLIAPLRQQTEEADRRVEPPDRQRDTIGTRFTNDGS
jgi:hypothetical protein